MTAERTRRSEKIQMFDDVAKLLVGAGYIYFVSYKGLKSKEFSDFRNDLAKSLRKSENSLLFNPL